MSQNYLGVMYPQMGKTLQGKFIPKVQPRKEQKEDTDLPEGVLLSFLAPGGFCFPPLGTFLFSGLRTCPHDFDFFLNLNGSFDYFLYNFRVDFLDVVCRHVSLAARGLSDTPPIFIGLL